MKYLTLGATLIVAALGVSSAEAGEAHRSVIIYGPAGTSTIDVNRSCYEGVCTMSKNVTDAYGNTATRSATTQQSAQGVYTRNSTISGPRGGSATRQSTLTINR